MSAAQSSRVRVAVTGLGAITPLGLDVESSWAACKGGRSGVVPISLCEASDLPTRIAGEVKGFDPVDHLGIKEARRTSRCVALGVAAARAAVTDSGLDVRSIGDDVGVLVASGIGGLEWLENGVVRLNEGGPRRVSPFTIPAMIPDMTAGRVAIDFGARGPNFAVVSACASSGNAIGEAADIIQADPDWCGGISELVKIAAVCSAFARWTSARVTRDRPSAATNSSTVGLPRSRPSIALFNPAT